MSDELDKRRTMRLIELLLDFHENDKLPVLKVINQYSDIDTVIPNLISHGYMESFEEGDQKFYRLTAKGKELVNEMIQEALKREEERKDKGDKKTHNDK